MRPLKNVQFCSRSRKANPPPNFGGLTTPYDLPDLRGRHEYIEYFEDKAKASLRAKIEPDTEIEQKGAFCKSLCTKAIKLNPQNKVDM
jgi:hypothetical protein